MLDQWMIQSPTPSNLGDRAVPQEGRHLAGKRIALLITGSIAAYRAPDLARSLRRQGATVVAFASHQALRYVTPEVLEWSTTHPVVTQLTGAAEHLSATAIGDDRPFDAYLVAPATYNTINKIRHGIADGVVTTAIASALGRLAAGETHVAIAPTLHGSLHNPVLVESLTQLQTWGVQVLPPRDAYGKHNLPDPTAITLALARALSRSPLRGVPILVTGGPTPVAIDQIRRLTNGFTGRLGLDIARELQWRGAAVRMILGPGGVEPPPGLPCDRVATYDEYRERVLMRLAERPYRYGIFSAAVADYRPATPHVGKLPSGQADLTISLVPTAKVIDAVQAQFPDLDLVTFKYQAGVTLPELWAIARQRLARGHRAVVANRGEDFGPNGEQVAYWVTGDQEPPRWEGKTQIAQAIADALATWLHPDSNP